MFKEFISPQTESVYSVVVDVPGLALVAFRVIEDGYRVRIQSSEEDVLESVSAMLSNSWGAVKNEDHLSVVVSGFGLAAALGDAVQAVFKTALVRDIL